MLTRQQTIQRILGWIGVTPYLWGGWSQSGSDCSGVASYMLNLPQKANHAQLIEMFNNKSVSQANSLPGTLWFYGQTPESISHVMVVLARWPNGVIKLVGARGGDETTINLEIATQQNAYVQQVDSSYWASHYQLALDPFLQ
jgi:cell wall-associated NlpC family hydrolase